MKPEILGGIAGVVIVVAYVIWRVSAFRYMFKRSGRIIRHLHKTKE